MASYILGIIGLWIGNRQAIGRDKRKEWNDLIIQARETLTPRRITRGSYVLEPDNAVIEDLCSLMACLQRWRFRRAYRNLKDILTFFKAKNGYKYEQKDEELVNKVVGDLKRFLKRR